MQVHRVNCWDPQHVEVVGISSQAVGSARSTAEGSETRAVSSVSNKRPHECPAPFGEKI